MAEQVRNRTAVQENFHHDIDVLDTVAYLLYKDASREEPDVTPLKLQKILYIAQANYLAATNFRLFDEPVEAFENGPVVHRITKLYFGRQIIVARDEEVSDWENIDTRLPEDIRDFLDRVWDQCKDLSASALWSRAHVESPWLDSYVKDSYRTVIPDELMATFYSEHIEADKRILHSAVVLIPKDFLDDAAEDDLELDCLRSFFAA